MPFLRVTGMGALSALGVGLAAARRGLYAPDIRAPRRTDRIKTTLELPVFEVEGVGPIPADTPGGRTVRLLEIALDEALDNAGLTAQMLARARVGVCVGTTVACQLNNIPFYAELRSGGAADAQALKNYIDGSPADYLHRKFALRGPALTVSNACASGSDAVGIGAMWIQSGWCDMAIVGGADEMNQVPLDGFHALGVCSDEPCRPFDARRKGLNLGEGAGVAILENPTFAAARGARSRAVCAGFGKTADAFHITQPAPDGSGLEHAVGNALAQAGITPEKIAFVNAHGTGTLANDAVEAQVLARVFGPRLRYMSTKSRTGHTLGAAGALEFIFSALMLERQLACASLGYGEASAEVPVAPLTENTEFSGAFALSTSLAFGGSNSALVIGLPECHAPGEGGCD